MLNYIYQKQYDLGKEYFHTKLAERYESPLHFVAKEHCPKDYEESVSAFVRECIQTNPEWMYVQNKQKKNPIQIAIQCGKQWMMNLMLVEGYQYNRDQTTYILHDMVESDWITESIRLIQEGHALNYPIEGIGGNRVMHICCQKKEFIHRIHEICSGGHLGGVLDIPNHAGMTPFHLALKFHQTALSNLSILSAFMPEDQRNEDLYEFYRSENRLYTLKNVLELGLDVRTAIYQGEPIFFRLISTNWTNESHIKDMVERGRADVHYVDPSSGNTALHIACTNKNTAVCKDLTTRGLSLFKANKTGVCPYHLFTDYNREYVVQILLLAPRIRRNAQVSALQRLPTELSRKLFDCLF